MVEFCSRCSSMANHMAWCFEHGREEPLCENCYQQGVKSGKITTNVMQFDNDTQYV